MKVTASEWYVLECLWEKEPQTLMNIFTRLNETQKETRSFLNRIYNGSVSMMMSALVARNELSDKDISELEQILGKLKRDI